MLKTHMAACLVATMFAAPAFAQAPASPSPNSSTPAPSAMPSAGSTSGSAMSGSFMTKIDPHQMLASELIGTKVISANNKSIGDINDVIVDRNGQAVAAVVGVGGFLGIGEKDVAVPFKSLEFATREQVKAMNTNKTVSTTGSTTGTTTTGTTATTGTMGNTAVNAPATSSSSASSMDNGEPERVILRMTKAELQAAPAFDTDRDSTTTTGTTGNNATTRPATPTAPAQKP